MHIPVLLEPILKIIQDHKAPMTIVDGTFGQGGYTKAFLSLGHRVIAFDRDPLAHDIAREFKKIHGNQFDFFQCEFSKLSQHIQEPVGAVVFDLGVSSPQIDTPERGFSVRFDGPLDMRMSQQGISAKEVVNTFSAEQLADIIYQYGEDRDSRKIARLIIKAREQKEIETTLELTKIISKVNFNPKKAFDSVIRTFQGIRIYVNNELAELQMGLRCAGKILSPEGLLMVVSFHSLEDRIVKDFLKESFGPLPPSRYVPLSHSVEPTFSAFKKGLIIPDQNEIDTNPRSRSAKLRVALRTNAPWEEKK
jgi:16S rRNA (cytosine1402-N4)-methyltransferase